MQGTDGIRGVDEAIQIFIDDNGIVELPDDIRLGLLKNFTLSFEYQGEIYVLAYDDKPDEAPAKLRGVYLFRWDEKGWYVASERIFTASIIWGISTNEWLISPVNDKTLFVERVGEDKFVMSVRHHYWTTAIENDAGYSGTYTNFLIFTPKTDTTFSCSIIEPVNKKNFLPENSEYKIFNTDSALKITTNSTVIEFPVDGERLWNSNVMLRHSIEDPKQKF